MSEGSMESDVLYDAWENAGRVASQCYSFAIPLGIGSGVIRQISTRRDVIVTDYRMRFASDIEVSGPANPSNVDLGFCLGEGLEWETSSDRRYSRIAAGETYLSDNLCGTERTRYLRERDYRFVGIKIPVRHFCDILSGYAGADEHDASAAHTPSFAKYAVMPSLYDILRQLLHPPYRGVVREMYMEAKLLELISVYIGDYILQSDRAPAEAAQLSRTDAQSVAKAREILDRNIVDPPSCSGLARMVHLSESKLMRAFKAHLGQPVHAYVIDKRLEHARRLFERGEGRVGFVAGMIGYANMSHFSAAFRKKYGVNPRDYVKNLRAVF